MTIWPKQRDCDMFYGNPRGEAGAVSVKWMLDNLISIVPPFRMTYAGIPVKRITVHKRCAESLSRVLAAIWIAAGKKHADSEFDVEWTILCNPSGTAGQRMFLVYDITAAAAS